MRLTFVFVLGLAVAISDTAPAVSQPRNVGSAISIVREVVQTDLLAGGAQRLSPGDAILYGNRLSAGIDSRGEFELDDETKLVLSANSSMVIDDLILSSNDTFSTVSLKAISGAFRFISGNSPSDAYQISSAVATLGIRGTAFDVYMGGGDRFAVMLLSGRLRLCNPRDPQRSCEDLTRRCEVAVSRRDNRPVEKLDRGTASIDGIPISQAFPFAANQTVLSSRFRVPGAENCIRRARIIERREQLREARLPPAPAAPPALGNPGTSGHTPGASQSIDSSASERARSNPGNSASSSAGNNGSNGNSGNNGKGKGKGKNKG